ncbi:magnesium/cobalt transporter CorA [Microvirga sp. STR05]|uniref:Magnesium transport protein CorA n=1 Tax=Hymenobacter duratus TaxID=2771356 RepID=A0ABR8JLJ7_9BACT|nr:magnesium/cobalt transporter CorA [Hymenobacter duratus]MBD2716997.1 magnesium/cobalt transporter CorA [Hymenobacter duratus]MBR7951913.1 magnesium/cobalt transporter CorA [Microvirga sp. STR05]
MEPSASSAVDSAADTAPLHPDDEKHNSIADRADTRLAREAHVGQRPGTLTIRAGAMTPRLFLLSYDEGSCTEQEYSDYDELWRFFSTHPELRHWIDVRGYNNLPLMERIMQDFDLHPLQMEDVLGDYQRAKVDVFGDNRLFLVSRMTEFTKLLEIDDDQLSIFTGPNYVLTFQDDYNDCLDTVRQRIRSGYSQIKRKPPLYLAYALTDVVLDQYYPTMAAIGDYVERLEDRILQDRPDRRVLSRILRMKKDIIRFRRFVYPEREKIAEILRMPDDVVPEEMKVYFRDCYDHAIQALDLAESYRESVTSLVELFMSNQSNRMNEVMKVLTIISSIFIPLSFVVGLYGMNFQRENPHGGINYLNMPELYSPWGYPILLAILAVIVMFQLLYFYRKGWLTNR